jgi:hypothetical protein
MQGPESPLAMSHDSKAMESAELAGIKDGVTVTPSCSSTGGDVVLSIKCPSLSDDSAGSNMLTVPEHCSIGQIKSRIESSWPGRPQAQGMRIFKSGRMLSDEMIVGDLVPPVSEEMFFHCRQTLISYAVSSLTGQSLLLSTSSSAPLPGLNLDLHNPGESPAQGHPAVSPAHTPPGCQQSHPHLLLSKFHRRLHCSLFPQCNFLSATVAQADLRRKKLTSPASLRIWSRQTMTLSDHS